MAYTITKTNGNVLTVINDGRVDSTTSLQLPGPNYVGYGLKLNENLVYLLENFASSAVPAGTPLQGQLWFNTSTQAMNVFTDQGWRPVRGLTVGQQAPATGQEGDTFFNTYTNQLFAYHASSWNLIGPQYTRGQGVSGAIPISIVDAQVSGQTHNVIQFQYGNLVIATMSSDPAFVPSPPMTGFPLINPGLTFNSTINASVYGNANVAVYLPHDPTISSINSSIALLNSNVTAGSSTANVSIQTANTAVVGYINDQIAITNSNWTANAVSQQTAINTLNANILAANSAIVTANSAVVGYVNTLNSSMIGNITAANIAWQANAVAQQTQINNLITGSYGNSNVATYLSTNTNTIKAPTQTYSDSSTNVATTAFVQNVLPRGVIVMWGGATNTIPAGWHLCDGSNQTPDLRNQFIVGAGTSYAVGATGGATSVGLSVSNLPAHSHTATLNGTTTAAGGHNHSASTSIIDPGHNHTIGYAAAGGWTGPWFEMNYDSNQKATSTSTTGITASTSITAVGDHQHPVGVSGSTDSTGTGAQVPTLPPYYALCYIQKIV